MSKIKYAFIKSLPVMAGYIFLGIAFGIVLSEAGYNYIWSFFMSVFVYAGSLQFAMVPLMAGGVSAIVMIMTAFFINARHLFYGLSFTEAFDKIKQKPYMIFALTDETYSVLCGCKTEDPDEKMREAWFYIALFDHSYWVFGSVLGAILGKAIPADFTGIDFSMTALFVVILIERILTDPKKNGIAAGISLIVAIVLLMFIGVSNFLLPSLIVSVLIVTILSMATRSVKGGKHE